MLRILRSAIIDKYNWREGEGEKDRERGGGWERERERERWFNSWYIQLEYISQTAQQIQARHACCRSHSTSHIQALYKVFYKLSTEVCYTGYKRESNVLVISHEQKVLPLQSLWSLSPPAFLSQPQWRSNTYQQYSTRTYCPLQSGS